MLNPMEINAVQVLSSTQYYFDLGLGKHYVMVRLCGIHAVSRFLIFQLKVPVFESHGSLLKAPVKRSIEHCLEEWISDPELLIKQSEETLERQLLKQLFSEFSKQPSTLSQLSVHMTIQPICHVPHDANSSGVDGVLDDVDSDISDASVEPDLEDGWQFGYCARLDLELKYQPSLLLNGKEFHVDVHIDNTNCS
jgi:hypothetical protein